MRNTHIEIKDISNDTIKGWNARIYLKGNISIGILDINESINFKSKKLAWESIKTKVKQLDFEKCKVYLNGTEVSSYIDAESEFIAIEERIYTSEEKNDAKKIIKKIK